MQEFCLVVLFCILFAPLSQARVEQHISGSVLDGQTGLPVENVSICLNDSSYRTKSDRFGLFRLADVSPGDYVLHMSAEGYRSVSTSFHLAPSEQKQIQLILSVDSQRKPDTVTVRSGSAFSLHGEDSVTQFSISGSDMKNLGTVLADDPLRAVQAIPGVTSNNDFEARFEVHGADPNRVGIFVDGVQLHQAVHTLEGVNTSGSNSVFNPELVEELTLHTEAIPPRLGNSSAAALEVSLRDGNRNAYSFRAAANFAYGGFMADGPVPGFKRCSWISGFRKSYLQYLLQQTLTDPSYSFGFQDAQARVSCTLTAANTVTLSAIHGPTNLDLSSHKDTLGPNSLMVSQQNFVAVMLGWQYVARDNLLLTSHLAWMQDGFQNVNSLQVPLGSGNYGELVGNSNALWMWSSNSTLSAGVSGRSIREAGYRDEYISPSAIQVAERFAGRALLTGSYFDQSWASTGGRVRINVGGRSDRYSLHAGTAFSPQAGLTFAPWRSTQFHLGWGQYLQYPEVSQSTSTLGSRALLPIRSAQSVVAVEQRIGDTVRLRAAFYNRQDRDLLSQPLFYPRLINGVLIAPPPNPKYANDLRGYSRGWQVLLQQASSNRLSGWVSYTYGRTTLRSTVTPGSFPANYDQRHTITAYSNYQLRPTLTLSARWSYGSGFPIPGFLESQQPKSYSWAYVYNIGSQRNQVRLPPYQRLDIRVNKSWTRGKWRKTLYSEVANVTNRANYRFDNFEGFDAPSRVAYITVDRMFPILPSIGIVLER